MALNIGAQLGRRTMVFRPGMTIRMGMFVALLVAIVSLSAGPSARALAVGVPDRLSDQEFWKLTVDLSEPDAEFISDNLVSNEMSFAQVVPQLRAAVEPGGVYLGVGPEQNFTYLSAMQAHMGFIIDIRRGNLQLQLMYKALFELSASRAEFVSRLFTRARPAQVTERSSATELMNAFADVPAGSQSTYRQNVQELHGVLAKHGFKLSDDDLSGIDQAYRAFYQYGPSIGYATTLRKQADSFVTYASLMKQLDASGQGLSFLATETAFQFVKDLQSRNLVVPVVGNFAGPKAFRAIGQYLRKRDAAVAAFYVSNVEDYLGREQVPANGNWRDFCANVATLPLNERSVFIRPLGLAVFAADGSLMMSKSMQLLSPNEAVTYPAGSHPPLPSALFPIAKEVTGCGGG